jgi:manganese/zinc/iron transport system permease protein
MLNYFTDPILRAPTIGCMLMCLAAALVGSIMFVRRRSLVGETLAHSSYPGVVIAVMLGAMFDEKFLMILVVFGALSFSLLGLWVVDFLENKFKVSSDSALCFVLSSAFGIGITVASRMQFSNAVLYKKIQVYFYGQAATMTDEYIFVYGALVLLILLALVLFYKEIQATYFDRSFSESIGLKTKVIDAVVLILVALSIIVGIRTAGFILVSGMLIAPSVAARQFTHNFGKMIFLSALFGVSGGFLGNYFSVELALIFADQVDVRFFSLPTGPMIVLVAMVFCVLAMLLAPERGFLPRIVRALEFRFKCAQENILKTIWRFGNGEGLSLVKIMSFQSMSLWYLRLVIYSLKRYVKKQEGNYILTQEGRGRAGRIVRLHRLWELYLVDALGIGEERVHRSAEEMEHIITPQIERELTEMLHDPKKDPHHQPIPPRGAL